ncbi:molecular chaperone DnaK, partial [Nostoc sp. CCCryo 231-06]|nr:molecular chaperone DnaK [Nostoc sp. CCCryo 231-06]
ALFVLTKDKLTVTQQKIDPKTFDELVTQYRREITDDDDDYDPPQRRDRPYYSNDEGFNRRRPQRPSYQDNWDDDDNWL